MANSSSEITINPWIITESFPSFQYGSLPGRYKSLTRVLGLKAVWEEGDDSGSSHSILCSCSLKCVRGQSLSALAYCDVRKPCSLSLLCCI